MTEEHLGALQETNKDKKNLIIDTYVWKRAHDSVQKPQTKVLHLSVLGAGCSQKGGDLGWSPLWPAHCVLQNALFSHQHALD